MHVAIDLNIIDNNGIFMDVTSKEYMTLSDAVALGYIVDKTGLTPTILSPVVTPSGDPANVSTDDEDGVVCVKGDVSQLEKSSLETIFPEKKSEPTDQTDDLSPNAAICDLLEDEYTNSSFSRSE